MIKLEYYLIVSTLMFFIGIFGFITRKSMIAILISRTCTECSRDKLRRLQPLPFPRTDGGNVLHYLRNSYHSRRDCHTADRTDVDTRRRRPRPRDGRARGGPERRAPLCAGERAGRAVPPALVDPRRAQ